MLTSIEQLLFFQRLPSVGASTYWKVREQFPALHVALELELDKLRGLLPPEAIEVIQSYHSQGDECQAIQQVKADVTWARLNGIHILDFDHKHYPELLKQTKRPPPVLYVLGDPECLSFPQISIVGTRNPSAAGRGTAFDFAAELAGSGFTVTSGLALGVDTAAHKGALSVQGRTIAALGTGIDQVYPNRNRQLFDEILKRGGAIISEFPIGTTALPQNFPQRNRVISGLSYGTLVVEAAVRSGSLITARYALQQDRELFAIPGSIHNPLSKGCHALIKEGAKLVETAQDIVEELKGFLSYKWEQVNERQHVVKAQPNIIEDDSENALNDSEQSILDVLGFDPMSIDGIAENCQLPVGDVMATLLTMELKGIVSSTGTGYVRIKQSIQA